MKKIVISIILFFLGCSGNDISSPNTDGSIDFSGRYDIFEYFYEDVNCEGDFPNLSTYECSNDCQKYDSMEECISSCNGGNCDNPYPHNTDSMNSIQINSDGTVQALWKLSDDFCDPEGDDFVATCLTDSDCIFSDHGISGFCGNTNFCYIYLEDTDEEDYYLNYHNWELNEYGQICFSYNIFYECMDDYFDSLDFCNSSCNMECEEVSTHSVCYNYQIDEETDVLTTIYQGNFHNGANCMMNIYNPID